CAQRAPRGLDQRQEIRDDRRIVAVGLEVGEVDVPRPPTVRRAGPGEEAVDDVVVVVDARGQKQAQRRHRRGREREDPGRDRSQGTPTGRDLHHLIFLLHYRLFSSTVLKLFLARGEET